VNDARSQDDRRQKRELPPCHTGRCRSAILFVAGQKVSDTTITCKMATCKKAERH
jgi:hypothetical protein